MELVIGIVILIAVLVVPVMIGARVVDARNKGFGSALLAVVIMALLGSLVSAMVPNEVIGFVVNLALGAAILAGVLGTTFLRGLAISVIATIIQVAVVVLFLGAYMAGAPTAA